MQSPLLKDFTDSKTDVSPIKYERVTFTFYVCLFIVTKPSTKKSRLRLAGKVQ